MVREENKKLKESNFLENCERQHKKLKFRKQQILEKE
jgi:hypothetical protein